MKFFIFFLPICLFFSLNAQTVTVSGIINNYASVNSIGSQSVNVSSTIGFNIGDRVLLIQMKGATIDTTNTLNFGTIASYNDAGNYEMLNIASISSTAISFTTPLLRTYNISGFVQLVKVPVYTNVNVIGLLTCSPWNGSSGGVLAFEASGIVTLNANIDITGKGFLGGGNVLGQFFSCSGNTTDYKLPTSSLASAFKGEGITNTHSTYSKGLGALANGGGAGNDVNGGGAGGGNYGLGGHGGNSICSSNPVSLCGGNNGKNCVYSNSNNKIFLGGGGGAGHQNDGVGTGGVSGGGIILIRCANLTGNNYSIISNGSDNTVIAGNDGQGGGAAGGTILIEACSSSSLTISAKGGFGGIDNYVGASCHGKGGGGGGGIIWTSTPLIYSSVLTGGLPGIFTSGSSPCFNTSNGATTGQIGGILSGLIIPGVTSSSGTFSLGISTICINSNNSTAIATITTNISSPIASYTWTNLNGTIISQTNNSTSLTDTVTNLTNGIYTLLAQINAPCGPIISQTININSISVTSSTTVCEGSNAILTATGSTTYTWSTGATTNSIIVNPSTTTSYTVTGTSGTCSNSAVSTVSVIPSPTITISPTLSLICSGQTASLTASGANTFAWSPSTTLSSNTGSMVASTPSITTIYTVTGTANTCTNSAITTVSVSPSPTITLSPNTSICQGSGSSATLIANGASSYTWNSATNLSSATGSIVMANPNSTETYTVTGSLNSCTNTAVTTVSVIATPTLSINSSSATICPLGSASLTATGATNYRWSPVSTLSSSSGSLVIASPSTTTTYTVLGSNGTCTNIAQAQSIITVTNNPIITSSNATICSSTSANLSANGGVTYTWSPVSNLNTTTGSNVISTPTASIMYTVSGSSALGCIGSSSVSVSVIPTPTLTISSNSLNLCIVGQSSTLTANGASSYTWSPTTTINSINTNSTIATPINTTIYSVIGSNGFSPNICTSTQTIQINVGASSIPTVSPNDEICFGQSTTIYAIGGNTYHWSPTTGVYKPNDSTTLVKPSVTTIYTVTVSKNNLCPVTATIQVIVDPLPIVDAGKDSTINIDQDIVLTGKGNVNVGFLSSDGNPLICNWCSIVTVHPLESTCYTLEGFNTFGCRNTDVVCITVAKEWDVFIPNAFTPNGDINNDYFIPKGYGIAQIDLSIFDRWGVCIFKETNTTLGWDGKYKGQLCQQGVYVYQVDIKAMSGKNTTKTGHVTLLSKLK